MKIDGIESPAKINGIASANIAKINGIEWTQYFTFNVQTVGINDTFALPLEASGTYNFEIDWGDGNTNTITVWNQAEVIHTYATGGSHTININGTIKGWRFNNGGDCTKMYDISSFGPLNLGNSNGYFYGCTNLTISATDKIDLIGTTTLLSSFSLCSSLTTAPSMTLWDTSTVTSIRNMFNGALLFNQNIGAWDVGAIESTFQTFRNASTFNQDISAWDTSSLINAGRMFRNASTFNQNISTWDVGNVIYANELFKDAISFNQNLGSWNITSCSNMIDMFDQITMSTVNYNALLTGWEAQVVQNNVTFSGGNSQYSSGAPATARVALIADHSWIISDGGQV